MPIVPSVLALPVTRLSPLPPESRAVNVTGFRLVYHNPTVLSGVAKAMVIPVGKQTTHSGQIT